MLRIVVTGGIGSGKTAVTDYLQSKGFMVIDSDKMAHEITAPGGKAIPYIREHFGDSYICPDGSMNREAMRNLVYSDPEALKTLEAGTTQVIIRDIQKRTEVEEARGARAIFLAIPLFIESGESTSAYDAVWSVIADSETRIRRVMNRDGLDEDMVRKIMATQVPDSVRLKASSDVIDNSGCLASLYPQVDLLLRKYGLNQKASVHAVKE